MAKVIKCPRCQHASDVTAVTPGAAIRCPDCGQMIRVPTGNTSLRVKPAAPPVPEVVAEPPAAQRPERGTRVRERERRGGTRVRQKSSNTPLILAVIFGAVAIVIVLIVVMGNSGRPPVTPPAGDTAMRPAAARPDPTPAPASPRTPDPGPGPGPAPAPEPLRSAPNPATQNWDQLLQMLRAGGGFDDASRPEGAAFKRVKDMGKTAYPYLVKYIDNEDPSLGRAAVVVLNELTGRKEPLPNDATKAKSKADWDAWVKANP